MRPAAPFRPSDLAALDERLLSAAIRIVPMREVAAGNTEPEVIGLRHDVDNVIEPAVAMAEWEAERGYRSTYYILHSAPYWQDKTLLRESVERIEACGHEIGLHNDAIAQAIATHRCPIDILADALDELNTYTQEPVRGTVAHGNALCYGPNGKVRFVNDEIWVECSRPDMGEPIRVVAGVAIFPYSLAYARLEYDANWLPRGMYLSDSGGRWSRPFDDVAAGFPYAGQLHLLVHPDWWGEAFVTDRVTA